MRKIRQIRRCNFLNCTSQVVMYFSQGRFKSYGRTCAIHNGYNWRKGALNPSWKGGKHPNKDGYIKVLDPRLASKRGDSRYILEHRLVAESKVGRPLHSYEIVHHLNGIRSDNRPENLVVIAAPNTQETWTYVRSLQARIRELEAQLLALLITSRNDSHWR